MSAFASGELFDVVVAKAVELEARVRDLESKLETQTEQRRITTGERNRLESELDGLRGSHGSRRSRVANAIESLRSTFTLRVDCNNIEDAVADACAELERVQVKRDKYRASYESKCTEADEAYSKGHDTLEFSIAEVIGREADSVDLEIQRVVANIIRQRDAAQARLTIVMAQDEPWSMLGVLRELSDAADHLLADHDCDTNGHEGIAAARDQARILIDRIEAQPPAPTPDAVVAELQADLDERKQTIGNEVAKRIKLEQRLERASMNKREAMDILTRCEQGIQNCHRCPALGCGDNMAGRA